MKTYFFLLSTLSLLICAQSCTVRVPMATMTSTKHNNAVNASNLSYQVKKKNTRTPFIVLGTAAAAGASYNYFWNQTVDSNGQPMTLEARQSQAIGGAAIGGLVGMYVSALLAKLFRLSKAKTSTESVSSQNFDKWLSDYNRKQNQNYVKVEQNSYSYLLVPKNKLTAFQAEEQRLKEEAERQRILAEQQRKEQEERDRITRLEREKQEEEDAYQAFINAKPSDDKPYRHYMSKFPKGKYIDEVKEKGERIAYDLVMKGSSGSIDTYLFFFPNGTRVDKVRGMLAMHKDLEKIRDLDKKTKTFKEYEELDELINLFFKTYLKENETTSDNYEGKLNRAFIASDLKIMQNWVRLAINMEKGMREAKIESAKKWVKGDNLCWEPSSFSTDSQGNKIKGSEGRTLIRAVIEETNEEKTRFKILVKELYDTTEKRNVDSFSMQNPKRTWKKNEIDWINPIDFDFDLCK